jgi:hypothetical protein
MAIEWRDTKGTSRLTLDYWELTRVVDLFVNLNSMIDLSTDEIDKLRWLALGLLVSSKGLPTSSFVGVSKYASQRQMPLFMNMADQSAPEADPRIQRAAALWLLSERRRPGVHEAIDPLDPAPASPTEVAA